MAVRTPGRGDISTEEIENPVQFPRGNDRKWTVFDRKAVMYGDRLDIQASVDLDGLKQLQAMLKKYEEILEMLS